MLQLADLPHGWYQAPATVAYSSPTPGATPRSACGLDALDSTLAGTARQFFFQPRQEVTLGEVAASFKNDTSASAAVLRFEHRAASCRNFLTADSPGTMKPRSVPSLGDYSKGYASEIDISPGDPEPSIFAYLTVVRVKRTVMLVDVLGSRPLDEQLFDSMVQRAFARVQGLA